MTFKRFPPFDLNLTIGIERLEEAEKKGYSLASYYLGLLYGKGLIVGPAGRSSLKDGYEYLKHFLETTYIINF